MLKIGLTCYPSYGGSGIVATELGLGLARRGHQVHFVTTARPARLPDDTPNVWFHLAEAPDYPVFTQVPLALALTGAMVRAAEAHGIEVWHTHYAVPHAASAWMAREILGGPLKVVTTLHGTDITVVGADPAYAAATRHAVAHSDAVTTPSAWLRSRAIEQFGFAAIEVIPNGVDPDRFRPGDPPPVPTLVHVSNFRPLKRVDRVVDVFAAVAARTDARLLLVGDGPDRSDALARLSARGLANRVVAPGAVGNVEEWVRQGTVFLQTSTSESFGLASLEALASGVPVVATAVGGVPEVVRDGETGFLVPEDDLASFAERVVRLLDDEPLRRSMAARARADVLDRFATDAVLDRYEALYRRILAVGAPKG